MVLPNAKISNAKFGIEDLPRLSGRNCLYVYFHHQSAARDLADSDIPVEVNIRNNCCSYITTTSAVPSTGEGTT